MAWWSASEMPPLGGIVWNLMVLYIIVRVVWAYGAGLYKYLVKKWRER